MRVLVIPEDPTLDQYILKPIIERVLAEAGGTGRVEVLQNPRMRGATHALNAGIVREIIEDNSMIDLFVLAVDRDCDRDGNVGLAEARANEHPGKLLSCLAVEEVEVWMLALHRQSLRTPWSEVRSDCDPKERHAEPFLDRMEWSLGVGGGRKRAMRDLAGQWQSLVSVCPELAELRDRVRAWIGARNGP